MKDKAARKYLDENEPFKSFEDLVDKKKMKYKSFCFLLGLGGELQAVLKYAKTS